MPGVSARRAGAVRGGAAAPDGGFADEAALAAAWAAAPPGTLRLADGRALRVVFPGVAGDGTGPDFRAAILEVDGDLVRGDVELHLRHSGWFAHGHDRDPAYAGVALHVVAGDDLGLPSTVHAAGRRIPLLVLAAPPAAPGAMFVPPCAFARAADIDVAGRLRRMGLRRLRMKANRAALLCAGRPAGDVLLGLAAGALLGPAARAGTERAAANLRLDVLLEEVGGLAGEARRTALGAALRRILPVDAAAPGGRVRPAATPAQRLGDLARLIDRWWPPGAGPGWPAALAPGAGWRAAAVEGVGRAAAVEVMANAVIPAALAAGRWSEAEAETAWAALPSPGTYGKLRPLERWLGGREARPFASAGLLQGGLLLQADYCAKGRCGRCPLSPPG